MRATPEADVSGSMRLRRILIILVPSLVTLVLTWLMPALILDGRVSTGAYVLMDYGVPYMLVAATAWASARFGHLGLRGSTLAGALVIVIGKAALFAAIFVYSKFLAPTYIKEPDVGPIAVALAAYVLLAIPTALLGAWVGARRRPRPRPS